MSNPIVSLCEGGLLMRLRTDRLKELLKRRSLGGWIFWLFAFLWARLGDWQNFEWLANHHLLPKAWPTVIHPNYLTVALIFGGFAWFTAVLLWPKREGVSGIVGTADVMVQGLDIPDLEVIDGGASYAIDLAVFARMEVASLDKARTITRFELEMVAPDGTMYRANSEYELGNYDYKYNVSQRNEWGSVSSRSVREPMEDLAARVRNPIHPGTHVSRSWIRFELKDVKQGHEPKNCQIKIYAINPSGKRHEITTNGMQVKDFSDRECAVARKQRSY
jgi:hypothetical protein